MATEECKNCGESIEPGYLICWNCGASTDGSPPDANFVPDNTPGPPTDLPKPRDLICLRCNAPMSVAGRMRFHEGTRAWPFLFGELGELFVNRETFDTYACTGCGKVEFFVTE